MKLEMTDFINSCSKNDFLALIMEYASHAELDMSDAEREYIIDKVGSESYKKADEYYQHHGDYQVLQDILALRKRFFPGNDGRADLHRYLIEFFMSDGELSTLEKVFDDTLEKLFED